MQPTTSWGLKQSMRVFKAVDVADLAFSKRQMSTSRVGIVGVAASTMGTFVGKGFSNQGVVVKSLEVVERRESPTGYLGGL